MMQHLGGGAAGPTCEVKLSNSFDYQVGIVSDTLRENYLMVALAFGVLLLGAYLMWLLAGNVVSTIRTYRRFTRQPVEELSFGRSADAPETAAIADYSSLGDLLSTDNDQGDDYAPAPLSADELLGGDLSSEREAVRKRIDEVKGLYADYNKQITAYSRDVLKKEPRHLMDERILAREYDVDADPKDGEDALEESNRRFHAAADSQRAHNLDRDLYEHAKTQI